MTKPTKERFAPTVIVDGAVVTPPGWVWILGFAMAGCDWAIKMADTPDFRGQIREWQRNQLISNHNRQVKYCEEEIGRLKNQLQIRLSALE